MNLFDVSKLDSFLEQIDYNVFDLSNNKDIREFLNYKVTQLNLFHVL